MNKCAMIALATAGVVGSALSIIAGADACAKVDVAAGAGAFATLLSVVLAVASIWYTCRVNTETEQLLTKIQEQNDKLVQKINLELRKGNYGEDNIANIERKFSR